MHTFIFKFVSVLMFSNETILSTHRIMANIICKLIRIFNSGPE